MPRRRTWLAVKQRLRLPRDGAIFSLSLAFLLLAFLHPLWPDPQPFETLEIIALVAASVLLQAIVWSQHVVSDLTAQGKYDWALWLARVLFWVPGLPRLLKGWVLLEAGRFREAQDELKAFAFGRDGKPVLENWSLYLYATALLFDEEYAAAEELFQAALQAPRHYFAFQYGLVDCLLLQHKEPTRAIELISQVLSDPAEQYMLAQRRSVRAQSLALFAWALAVCGKKTDAEARLLEAFAESSSLGERSLASLMQLKGLTLKSLGDLEAARTAFNESLQLFPFGASAITARRRLTELDENR